MSLWITPVSSLPSFLIKEVSCTWIVQLWPGVNLIKPSHPFPGGLQGWNHPCEMNGVWYEKTFSLFTPEKTSSVFSRWRHLIAFNTALFLKNLPHRPSGKPQTPNHTGQADTSSPLSPLQFQTKPAQLMEIRSIWQHYSHRVMMDTEWKIISLIDYPILWESITDQTRQSSLLSTYINHTWVLVAHDPMTRDAVSSVCLKD